jgi:Na+/H+-dicarboxylate symporter
VFAIVFGVALGRVLHGKRDLESGSSFVVNILEELSEVLLKMINWIIR